MRRFINWVCRVWDDLTFDPDSFSLEACDDEHEEGDES